MTGQDEILRVRVYLTPEESAFVEDVQIARAWEMASTVGVPSPAFAARIVRKALAKGMMP